MKSAKWFACAALASAALTAPQTAMADQGMTDAHNIRTLDMMLMATSLRCRHGAHDFRAEYGEFSRHNKHHLNGANAKVRRNLSATYGQRASIRELDRMSVRMANRYGNGHPWLGCAELKVAAGDLARAHTQASLAAAAARLLTPPRIKVEFP